MIIQEHLDRQHGEEDQCGSVQDQHIPALPSGSIYSDIDLLNVLLLLYLPALPLLVLSFWRLRKAL
jgi:hypothetical protein